jgi:hypothetical protein
LGTLLSFGRAKEAVLHRGTTGAASFTRHWG